jgi:5-methyltetrahydropteroyltriglutamate--homocysteine methyltransferase
VDTQDDTVEPVAVIRERIQAALGVLDSSRLWLSPDCGLRNLAHASAKAKLSNLVEAANAVRATL